MFKETYFRKVISPLRILSSAIRLASAAVSPSLARSAWSLSSSALASASLSILTTKAEISKFAACWFNLAWVWTKSYPNDLKFCILQEAKRLTHLITTNFYHHNMNRNFNIELTKNVCYSRSLLDKLNVANRIRCTERLAQGLSTSRAMKEF